MKLNHEAFSEFVKSRGWSEIQLARKLNLDYSFVYRVMRNQRGIGGKFITALYKLCKKEGEDFRKYIIIE